MTEHEMIAGMIRIGVEDNCSIEQAKENEMTNTLKLTRDGKKITIKVNVETEIDFPLIDNQAEAFLTSLDNRLEKALRNIEDHDLVKIDSKGQMTCVQLAEGEKEGEEDE